MAEVNKETIGCDLGDKFSELFIITGDAKTGTRERVATTKAAMKKFFKRQPAHVIIENGTHSRWCSFLLTDLGHQVTVANPRHVRLISKSQSKNDKKDAELLARLGRADVTLLSPITHRADGTQADLAVPKARDALVRCRTKVVNQVRGLVKSFGLRLPSCEAAGFHRRVVKEIPESLKPAVDPLLKALEAIGEQIKKFDETIKEMAKRYPDVEIVSQVSGVGVLTAMVFLLTLEDKTRFKKSRQVGAFLGLRPRQDQSGDTDKQLSITKAGDPFLRRLLVGSANYILGPFGEDSELRQWGLKLAGPKGTSGRARARAKVAVARKLGVLMHRLWVTGENYQPLGYQQRAKAA